MGAKIFGDFEILDLRKISAKVSKVSGDLAFDVICVPLLFVREDDPFPVRASFVWVVASAPVWGPLALLSAHLSKAI